MSIANIVCTENYIDGKEFLTLTEQEIKTMVPPIGLARKIIRLVCHDKEVCVLCSLSVSEPIMIPNNARPNNLMS